MKQHKLKQGSPDWHAHRRNFRNASDAPAMMGCSPYKTRQQLLHETYTGITGEVGQEQQRRFDDGHRFEALARPLAEEFIGQKLYPVVGSKDNLSASFDGLTMACIINYEHKSLNNELRAVMVEGCTGADLPLPYRVQMEQQHMVSGAEKTIFVASKWQGNDLVEERHCWYTPDPELAKEIAAGWAQFEIDLASYVPPAAGKAEAVAKPTLNLPAVTIKVEGNLALVDNLELFGTALTAYIEGINLKPETDQDFADLDGAAKTLKRAEEALEAAKNGALAQTTSIEQMVRTVDQYKALCKTNRLIADKLYETEKASRKAAIVLGGRDALAKHINALNERLGQPYMPLIQADFAEAAKGLKTISSIQSAVNTELSRAKIDANAIADRIQKNRAMLRPQDGVEGEDWIRLFPDFGQMCTKANEDFQNLVSARVAVEKERVDAERQKIRDEEQAKADEKAAQASEMAMQQIQGIQQQVMIATLGRAGVRKGGTIECIKETLAETEAWVIDEEQFGTHVALAQGAKDKAVADILALLEAAQTKAAEVPKSATEETHPNGAPMYSATTFKDNGQPIMLNADGTRSVFCDLADGDENAPAAPAVSPAAAPTANVVAMRQPAAVAPILTPPALKLGVLNERLAPIQLTAAGLAVLGFEAAGKAGSAVLYHERDFPHICAAVIEHVNQVQAKQAA